MNNLPYAGSKHLEQENLLVSNPMQKFSLKDPLIQARQQKAYPQNYQPPSMWDAPDEAALAHIK